MRRRELAERMARFREACRSLGLSATYQRLAIYKALVTLPHPSPDEICRIVRKTYPSLSLATVYKTLERLERAGIAGKVNLLHEAARFEARPDPHHHVMCVDCKRIDDLEPASLGAPLPATIDGLGLPDSVRRDYHLLGYSLMVRGLCRACQGKPRGRGGPA